MKVLMSADPGKNTLKAIGKEIGSEDVKKISFPSKFHFTNDINEDYEGNSHQIVLDDKIIILGDSGADYDYDSNKEKDFHRACVYTAITQLLEPNTKDNKVYMVLACPVDFIRNKELKDNYKQFIKGNGEINCKVDGNEYNFTIEDITIKSEGSGVIYNHVEDFKDKEIALIDLGGVNFSFCIYNNCVAKKESRFARDFGGNYLNTNAISELRVFAKGKPISGELALTSLKEDVLTLAEKKDSKSIEVIRNIKKAYLDKIVDEIKKAGQSIDVAKPVFCGGTTELIKDTISDEISHAKVVDNPQWESVEGLYVVANTKYNGK